MYDESISPSRDRWLAAMWPVVRGQLPPAPASVLEIGCGPLGGFVPMLEERGHTAVGVDPEAPEGSQYLQVMFEEADFSAPFDAVVACTSLHHIAEPARVVASIVDALRAEGTLVVVEWDWQNFDEATVRWGFERLDLAGDGWLHRRCDAWVSSGRSWNEYIRSWASNEGVHGWSELSACLGEQFVCTHLGRGPYLFVDLEDTSAMDEQAAIDAGLIRATRVDYVGIPRGAA